MAIHTTSEEPATAAQIKLCNDLIDAGAPFDRLNWLEDGSATKRECSEFVRKNNDIYATLKKERGRKRRLDDIAKRSTPDQYNVPNM